MKRLLFLVIAIWLSVLGFDRAALAGPVQLLTAAEAARPDLPEPNPLAPEANKGLSKAEATPSGVPGAPQILVDMPQPGTEVSAPFPVKIRFVPSPGSKINVSSVRIEVLKIVSVSLLSRVKPYLSPAGINVPEAKIPAGTYNVRIAVADDQGREGTTVQMWTVR